MRASLTKLLLAATLAAGVSASAFAQSGIVRTIPLDSGFDPAAAGAIDPSSAELSADLWRGSDRADMARLIAGLPARIQSATLADLARRTLAVAATPPEGAKTAPGFAETRAEALLAIGQADLAARLLGGIPKSSRNEAADVLLLNASLLARDNSGACAVARGRAVTSSVLLFSKMLTVCEALAGDQLRANLGAQLLLEREPNDPAFFELLDMMTGAVDKPGRAVAALKAPTPLHLAMMRAVNVPPPALSAVDPADRGQVAQEAMIAADPNAPPPLRMAAAWRALRVGAGEYEPTRQLFFALGGQAPGGSVARHYAAAAAASDGPDKTIALARLLLAGKAAAGYSATAELVHPMLRDLLALASGPDIALRIGRGLVTVGEPKPAMNWLRSLDGAGKVPGAPDAAARLAALISLAEGQDVRPFDGPRAVLWNAAINGKDAAAAPGKALLMAKLRRAVGLPVPPSLAGAAQAYAGGGAPSPLTLLPLQNAAAEKRVGEAVLRALHLVEVNGEGARAHRLAEAAQALSTVGLFEDARFLALEAAVEADL
jgi:hypothetical protein